MKNPILNLFKYTWRYSPNKKWLAFLIFLHVLGASAHIVPPYIIGKVFNSIQLSLNDPEMFFYLTKNLIFVLVIILLGSLLFHVARILERRNAFLTRKNYKNEMFNKVLVLPASWHKDHHSGDTIDKINKSSQNIRNFSADLFHLIRIFIHFLGSAIILFLFDWKAMSIAFICSALIFLVIRRIDIYLAKKYKIIFKAENFLASAIHDYISNIITIITLRLKRRVSKEIDERAMKEYKTMKKVSFIDETKWFSMDIYVISLSTGIIIWNAYSSYSIGEPIMIGTLYILYGYLGRINQIFNDFTGRYSNIVRQSTAVTEAENITEAHTKLVDKKPRKKYYLPKNWNTIKIKDLYFNYKSKKIGANFKSNNIHKASFVIERHKRIALIGESGSGKSTILSLIRGLHSPNEVKAYADGKRLDHNFSHLYECTNLIPQDPEIFNTTIKDNITMGVPFEKEDLEKAIKLARFDSVIERFKNGLKTNVMEKGVSLSGGEKQRLALARGILMAKEYDILLLDEPTSSVDSENELEIYKSIFEEFPKKTILSAIHRLHLLRYFDYIYFWDNGRIIAEGTFNTLMNDEKFRKMWEAYSKKNR